MSNRVFSINEDEINTLVTGMENAASKVDAANQTMSSSLKGAQESGLFGNAIEKLENQIKKISTTGKSIKEKIKRQNDAIKENERILTSKIENIESPRDFVKTYSKKYLTLEDIELSKKDGRSINEGEKGIQKVGIEEANVEKENLKDITGGEIEKTKVEIESKVEEARLKDITGEEVEKTEVEIENKVEKARLGNINNGETINKVELNNSTEIDTTKLMDIYNNGSLDGNQFSFESSSPTYSTQEEKKEERDSLQEMLNNYSIMNEFERKQEQTRNANEEIEVY